MEKDQLIKPIRVITVDDHEILRGGIKFSLLAFDDIELVAEARNGKEAIHLCAELQPDVVLMDLMMPEMNGVQTTRFIKNKYPKIQVLVLTSFVETDLLQEVMEAGAIGYLLKGASIDELADALRSAAAGLCKVASEALVALFQQPQSLSQPVYKLTKRQEEVLALLSVGLTNEAIAQKLKISPSTIRHHVTQILNKLGVENRTEAATTAVRVGCLQ
ncbi:response regulator transcription factor [Anabaena sp. UHCC 0451]|uniref:response regulator transcription factor n=1 Tax=Anabaena sp. UHCC 0451 TaxID=2055235 RepID=UPI002B2143C4|nr:response regulator transcription factor [Anabaena sp. UHCC 0451]MEA5576707.1 response regulator transcription factor [Anabaena sp. UHCC 0451]